MKYQQLEKICPVCSATFVTLAGHKKEKTACSRQCANKYFRLGSTLSDSTKEKISRGIGNFLINTPPKNNKIKIKCAMCNKEIEKFPCLVRTHNFCSVSCGSKYKWTQPECRDRIVKCMKKKCANPIEKNRLKTIGRKGGFGEKGYTTNGVRYQSRFEKCSFEYMEKIGLTYIPHKNIPNSSKITDIYLPLFDLWIELDGINREKKKKWLGKDYVYWKDKLEIYEREHLKYKIIYTFDEFKDLINGLMHT